LFVTTGILIGSLCSDLKQVLGVAVASNLTTIILGGLFWPLESMPLYLRRCVYFLPETYPILALRSVIIQGRGFDHPDVVYGLMSSFSWIVGFAILSVIVIFKTNK